MASMFDDFPTVSSTSVHAWGREARFEARVPQLGRVQQPYIVFRVGAVLDLYLSRETAERAVAALQSAIAEFDAIEVAS